MKCEDCGNPRAKGPPRRIRLTLNENALAVIEGMDPAEIGKSVERTVCASCYRFRLGLSYFDLRVLEGQPA